MFTTLFKRFSPKKVVIYFFSSLGVMWLLIEIVAFFNEPSEEWFNEFSFQIQAVMVTGSLIYALISNWPPRTYLRKIAGTDISIEIRLMDIFQSKQSSIIIPINRYFDLLLDGAVKKSTSTQSQFLSKILKNQPEQIELLQRNLVDLAEQDPSKRIEQGGFQFGTTISVEREGKTWYFFASTDLNEHKRAIGTYDQLLQSLIGLWKNIPLLGIKETLAIPLIGSGSARVTDQAGKPITRDQIAHLIIQSFIRYVMKTPFSNKLIIAIYPNDFQRGLVKFDELGEYLDFVCRYPEIVSSRKLN